MRRLFIISSTPVVNGASLLLKSLRALPSRESLILKNERLNLIKGSGNEGLHLRKHAFQDPIHLVVKSLS